MTRPVPQVTCHDCLRVQPALFTEPTVDGYLQECVNCFITIHHRMRLPRAGAIHHEKEKP